MASPGSKKIIERKTEDGTNHIVLQYNTKIHIASVT